MFIWLNINRTREDRCDKYYCSNLLQMFKSRKIRSASGKVAFLLSASAIAHYRRRTVAAKSCRDIARVTKVPQDHARFQLLVSFEVRSEERILLSSYQ